ncbi:MAG: NAD-dependent deacylase [Bacteroidetes bacterium]|nr:NAD-dependent deacylase [Bacteroidota bacterium]
MKKVVVFTGAGVSAESGIKTFRDSNGLWEEHRIEDVATPEAWQRNPELVQSFYNDRRKQLLEVEPNQAHYSIANLTNYFSTKVITQNVDDLHERAGSKNVLHLHGELRKSRSTVNPSLVYDIPGWELGMGDTCAMGSQLRPHIVWFGEAVPLMEHAIMQAQDADIFIVIGSSLEVYPAASLIEFAPENCVKYFIDPNARKLGHIQNLHVIKGTAASEVPKLVEHLIAR